MCVAIGPHFDRLVIKTIIRSNQEEQSPHLFVLPVAHQQFAHRGNRFLPIGLHGIVEYSPQRHHIAQIALLQLVLKQPDSQATAPGQSIARCQLRQERERLTVECEQMTRWVKQGSEK